MNATVRILATGVILAFSAPVVCVAETNSQPAKIIPARSMLMMGGIVTAPERKTSPLFTGKALPQPPKQHAAWSPPKSNLPTNYVSATALLFEQGLADPRGCDYRELEVGTGNVWCGDGGVVKTHGWVLPSRGEQRFAIGWNGLVYPAVSIGTNADLAADVATMATKGIVSWQSAISEGMSVEVNTLQGIRGCLLLRLGKVDLATEFWLAQARRGTGYRNEMMIRIGQTNNVVLTNEIKLPEADPYLTWASDWAWTLLDRMICAHERGDEKLALADARQLAAAQPQIETECAKRGFKRQPYWDSRRQKEMQPYLNFLEQLPQLLADLDRRDKEGVRVSVITRGVTNITDQAERVQALVRDLDLVQAHQWGQPGAVNLPEDSIVSALIGEGDAAVEPLLDCLQHDERLTRSVGFGRDFHRSRTVIAVKSAADVALKSILQAGFSNAAEMRAYWNQYKSLKIEDRWYAILNDDNARNRWQEAAANIVRPDNVTRFPGGFSMEKPLPTNAPVRLRGEVLRSKTNPSITEILARHALEVPTNNIGSYDLSACCQMAEYLARWDAQAALPVARTLSKRATTVMKYSGQQLGNYLTRLSLARAQAGDPNAFDDYAEWIVTTMPAQFEQSNLECLEPFRKCPTNIMLQAAAEKLFSQTNSAWGSLPWKNNFGRGAVESDLVAVPAYRVLLCRELAKTNSCGTVTLERPGYLRFNIEDLHPSGTFGISLPDGSMATNGSIAQVRWCDWVAVALANGKHIAPFDPFAPTTNRDLLIQQAISRLESSLHETKLDHMQPRLVSTIYVIELADGIRKSGVLRQPSLRIQDNWQPLPPG